jgi:hypothetical protein
MSFGTSRGRLTTRAELYIAAWSSPSAAAAPANLYMTDVTSFELLLLLESSLLLILKDKGQNDKQCSYK